MFEPLKKPVESSAVHRGPPYSGSVAWRVREYPRRHRGNICTWRGPAFMTPVGLPDRDFPEHAGHEGYGAADYVPGKLTIVSLHISPTEQRPGNCS